MDDEYIYISNQSVRKVVFDFNSFVKLGSVKFSKPKLRLDFDLSDVDLAKPYNEGIVIDPYSGSWLYTANDIL